MKIENGFMLKKINGVNTVIAVGNATEILNGMLVLNDTCAFLWELIEKGESEEQLVKSLTGIYDVSEEKAKQDVADFLTRLKNLKIIRI